MERIRVPIPIPALKYVNSYVILGDETIIIDPGMLSGKSLLFLAKGLRKLGISFNKIDKIILTHFHVDHSSAAALLGLDSSEIYAGRFDAEYLNSEFKEYVVAATKLFEKNGTPESEIKLMISNHPALRLEYAYDTLRGLGVKGLREGDVIRVGGEELRIMETPGHTPGSIILVNDEQGFAITGDTLLPGITPHITLHDPLSDPLGDYLKSLERIIKMKMKIAYPGHREPIENPSIRALEIIRHHEERLREITNLLRREGPQTAFELAKKIKWRVRYSSWSEYPPAERFFALGETLAHLRHLEVRGVVEAFEKNNTLYWKVSEI